MTGVMPGALRRGSDGKEMTGVKIRRPSSPGALRRGSDGK